MLATKYNLNTMHIGVVVKNTAIGARGLDLIPEPVKSDTLLPIARHGYDVSSELCCQGAKLQRQSPPFHTRFGVIQRVE